MARYRNDPDRGLRDLVAARLRRLVDGYPDVSTWQGCPWRDRLAAIDGGETVEVAGWEVGRPSVARVAVDADGVVHVRGG